MHLDPQFFQSSTHIASETDFKCAITKIKRVPRWIDTPLSTRLSLQNSPRNGLLVFHPALNTITWLHLGAYDHSYQDKKGIGARLSQGSNLTIEIRGFKNKIKVVVHFVPRMKVFSWNAHTPLKQNAFTSITLFFFSYQQFPLSTRPTVTSVFGWRWYSFSCSEEAGIETHDHLSWPVRAAYLMLEAKWCTVVPW